MSLSSMASASLSSSSPAAAAAAKRVWAYHKESKHSPDHFAPSLSHMDWENQPDPFRRYHGSPRFALSHPPDGVTFSSPLALDHIYTPSTRPVADLSLTSISQLFYYSMGLSAWKKGFGNAWPLRCNPSSGNLHPTESYVMLPPKVDGLTERLSVFHYMPYMHALELRADLSEDDKGGHVKTIFDKLPQGAFLVALTSIPWRESWKYGVRALRYCHLDAGHAVAALAFAASLLGWETRVVLDVPDNVVGQLLGIGSKSFEEAEDPDVLLMIAPWNSIKSDERGSGECSRNAEGVEGRPSQQLTKTVGDLLTAEEVKRMKLRIEDQPNRLSKEQFVWKEINVARTATFRDHGLSVHPWIAPLSNDELQEHRTSVNAFQIIRQRRSAQRMSKTGVMEQEDFFRTLRLTLPRRGRQPFSAFPWAPHINLFLFVHRVAGIEAGLYALVRNPDSLDSLRRHSDSDFAWSRVQHHGAPEELYFLKSGNCEKIAQLLSCDQTIAGNGAFAVSMMADFSAGLQTFGSWFYRALHWEAGAIGQVLYIEAEAAGIAGTGIGCYFDNRTLELFGIDGNVTSESTMPALQSVYHFTVGSAIKDARIQTIPAYQHLQQQDPGASSALSG